jgi:phosphoribosylglycinamide formyltransferase-1
MIYKLLILGSGSGTNAHKICEYFKNHSKIKVVALMSNKPKAGFESIAYEFSIPLIKVTKTEFSTSEFWNMVKDTYQPDLVVLAGFLWLLPAECLRIFPRIINIHPSLLPKYGGKGMYGKNVHQAVLSNNETESGITLHFVNEKFDEGKIIAQFKVQVPNEKTVDSLAKAIQKLEHEHYAPEIEKLLLNEN